MGAMFEVYWCGILSSPPGMIGYLSFVQLFRYQSKKSSMGKAMRYKGIKVTV